MLLEGRSALITGAAQGIGFAIAREFGTQGAAVMISDIDEGVAEKAAGILREEGVTATSVRCDVSEEAAVEAAVSSCVAELGSIDIMVNNAGITRDATLHKMTVNQFDQVINTRLKGTWLGSVLPVRSCVTSGADRS